MNWFNNLKIAKKLAFAFGVCLAISALLVVTSVKSLDAVNQKSQQIVSGVVARTQLLVELTNNMRLVRLFQFNALAQQDQDARMSSVSKAIETSKTVDSQIDDYIKLVRQPDDKKNINNLHEAWDSYNSEFEKFSGFMERKQETQGTTFILSLKPKFDKISDNLVKMADWNKQRANQLHKEAEAADSSGRNSMYTMFLVLIFTIFGVSILTTKSITNIVTQINQRLNSLASICITNLGAAVKSLANGDLTAEIQTGTTLINSKQKDELGQMASDIDKIILNTQGTVQSFQSAQEALSRLVGKVQGATNSIAAGTTEVTNGNTDLSQRTEEQAASLEETASSMEEMTSTIRQNADNANLANSLATQAREVAETGGQVVVQAVSAMSEINEGSRKIAEIITVIDEIAFQTNLLALNAADEAARVGEQGRGFAVVAAEVRSLAQRSATAAREIKALVQDSVGKVETGADLVNASGERLTEIVASVKKVADVIAEISAASQEQAAGVEQVNKAVMLMDQTTQQNAALVEEVSAASHSMSAQARELQRTVQEFRVDPRYLMTVENSGVSIHRLAATGTDGPEVSSTRRDKKQLTVVSKDDFEEF